MLFIFPKGFYPIRKWKKVTDVWKIIIFKKLAADVVFATKRKKVRGYPFRWGYPFRVFDGYHIKF